MYRKTIIRKQMERKERKCAVMRAAKEQKRFLESVGLSPSGWIHTGGCLGDHIIELLAYPDGQHVAIVVDGQQRRPRTMRGVFKCVAKMAGKGLT